jgi:RNA polymerase sigma factor (sigma-70 family)
MLPAPPANAEFPATHWTLIAEATGPDRDSALSRLYQIYWQPLCAQTRRFGVPANDAEDAVQDLFVSLFRSGTLAHVDRLRGRFRSYLLGALRNHLSHRRARELSQKRGAAQPVLSLDSLDPSQAPLAAAMDDREFDAAWAHALLGEALRRFRHEEQHSKESRASFEVLGGCALGDEELPSAEAAKRLGITVPAVKSRVFRLRQRFHQIMREEVLRTVATEAECDEELRYLSAVLEKVDGVASAEAAG